MLGSLMPPTRGRFGKRFTRRGQMNSKMGNVTFYKGNGARNEGVHTNKGAYVIRPERLMTIVAPDLTNCDLKPYVHKAVKRPKDGERVPDFASMVNANEDGRMR